MRNCDTCFYLPEAEESTICRECFDAVSPGAKKHTYPHWRERTWHTGFGWPVARPPESPTKPPVEKTAMPRKYPISIHYIPEDGGYYYPYLPDFGSACSATGETLCGVLTNLARVQKVITAFYTEEKRPLPESSPLPWEKAKTHGK